MLNLELCMLTCSHAHHGAFHGHLRDTEAHQKDIEAHPGAVEAHCGALYAHPQLYFAINITASSCHSSCDAISLKQPNLVKNYSKFREIKTIFV